MLHLYNITVSGKEEQVHGSVWPGHHLISHSSLRFTRFQSRQHITYNRRPVHDDNDFPYCGSSFEILFCTQKPLFLPIEAPAGHILFYINLFQ
jgi:hypothetical protein